VYGTHLIVGPELPTAEKLLQQERLATAMTTSTAGKYKPSSAAHPRDYDDWWFLADLSHGIKPLIFQMREEISTMETGPNGMPAFNVDELWFGAQARYNVGYFEPRLIVGSVVA
jgi:phage major head subunit gpT-like protein